MRALVVIAHPCDDSFSHAAARSAAAGLQTAGHEVDTIDIHADGFQAAMTLAERLAYETDEPVLDPLVAGYVERLQRAQILVFVYPTWWSGMPAILKGWLERVMVLDVAFVFDRRSGKVRPGLRDVRRIVGISTYGSSRLPVMIVNDNGRRTIARALRMACGLRTRTTWLALYGMDTADDAARARFLTRIEQRMARV